MCNLKTTAPRGNCLSSFPHHYVHKQITPQKKSKNTIKYTTSSSQHNQYSLSYIDTQIFKLQHTYIKKQLSKSKDHTSLNTIKTLVKKRLQKSKNMKNNKKNITKKPTPPAFKIHPT